eukprot:COSAG01_NODE_6639_length_3567_cov_37.767013_5_plen_380_part_00
MRTEHCTRCMSLVKMRDMERHLASGCRIGGVRPQASQPSPTAAAASRGGAMSLLSPELGFAGAAAVQPSLYACPLCGLNCQSFEELQSHTAQHHSRRGGAAAAGAQRAGGAARSDGRRAKKRQQRSGVAGADGGGSGRVGDVGGSPPARRRRRTNADWEAEMQAALAGRHGRRGGQAGAAVAATNGAADDDSDADSSEDDDWRPDERVDGMRRVGRGLADAADTGMMQHRPCRVHLYVSARLCCVGGTAVLLCFQEATAATRMTTTTTTRSCSERWRCLVRRGGRTLVRRQPGTARTHSCNWHWRCRLRCRPPSRPVQPRRRRYRGRSERRRGSERPRPGVGLLLVERRRRGGPELCWSSTHLRMRTDSQTCGMYYLLK